MKAPTPSRPITAVAMDVGPQVKGGRDDERSFAICEFAELRVSAVTYRPPEGTAAMPRGSKPSNDLPKNTSRPAPATDGLTARPCPRDGVAGKVRCKHRSRINMSPVKVDQRRYIARFGCRRAPLPARKREAAAPASINIRTYPTIECLPPNPNVVARITHQTPELIVEEQSQPSPSHLVSIITGQTALLATFIELLISKNVITREETCDVVERLLITAREEGADRAVAGAPLHLLSLLNRQRKPHRESSH